MSESCPRKARTPKKIRARREIFLPSDEIPTKDYSKKLSRPTTRKSVLNDHSNVLTRRSCPDLSKSALEFRNHPQTRSDNGRNIEQLRYLDGCVRCFSSTILNSEMDPNFTNNSAQEQGSSTSLPNASESLTNNIFKLWKNKTLCDVIITAGGQQFYAHRLVLAASCEHFTRQTHSNSEAVIHYDLPDVSAEVMADVLNFFYTSNINISPVNVEQLLQASQKLGAKKLQDRCCEYLLSINLNNAMKHRVIASKYNLTSISKTIDEYMYEHFAAIIDSTSFLKSDFRYVYDTIASDLLKNLDELTIFHTCVKWIDYNRDQRLKFAVPLMNQVRFSQIPACDIVSQVEPVSFMFDIPECKDMLYIAFRHHALLVEGRPMNDIKQINKYEHQLGSTSNEPHHRFRKRETTGKSEKSRNDMKYMMYSTIIGDDSKQNNPVKLNTDTKTKPMANTSESHRKAKHADKTSMSKDDNDSQVKTKEQTTETHNTVHHAERNALNVDKNKPTKSKGDAPNHVDKNALNTERLKSKIKSKRDPSERAVKNPLNTDKSKSKNKLTDDAEEPHDRVKKADKRKSTKRSRMSSKSPDKTRRRHRSDSTNVSPEKLPMAEAKLNPVVDSIETNAGNIKSKKISHEDLANVTDFVRPNGSQIENKNENKASMIDLVKKIADKTCEKQRIKTPKYSLKTTLDDDKTSLSPRKLPKETVSAKHSKMKHNKDFKDSDIKSTLNSEHNKTSESVNNLVSKHSTKNLGSDNILEINPSHREQLTDTLYTNHSNLTNILDLDDSHKELSHEIETYGSPVNKHSMNALTMKGSSSTKQFNQRLSDSNADSVTHSIEPTHKMSVANNSANSDVVNCLECESIHRQRMSTMELQRGAKEQEIPPDVEGKTTIGRQSVKRHGPYYSGTMHMNTEVLDHDLHRNTSETRSNEIGRTNSNNPKNVVSKHSNAANNSVIRASGSESTIEYDYVPNKSKGSRAVKPFVATNMQCSNEPNKTFYSRNEHALDLKHSTTTNKHARGVSNECLNVRPEFMRFENNDDERKESKHVLLRRQPNSQTTELLSTTMKEINSLPEDNHDIPYTDLSMNSDNAKASNPHNDSDQQKERVSIHKKPSATRYFKNAGLADNELNANPLQITENTKFVVPRMLLMDSSDTDNSLSSYMHNNWQKFSKDDSNPTDSQMNDKALHQQKSKGFLSDIKSRPRTIYTDEINDVQRVESDSRLFADPVAEFRNETTGELAPGYVRAMSKRRQMANTIIRGLLQLREPCIHKISEDVGTQNVNFKTCDLKRTHDEIPQPFQEQQPMEVLAKPSLTKSNLPNLSPKPFPPTAILVVGCESAHDTNDKNHVFSVQQFDPKKGIWSLKCHLPTSVNRCGATVLKNIFYVCGGLKRNFGTKVPVNDCYRYDATSGHWEIVSPLNIARSGHAAVTLFDRIYVLGGEDSYGFSCNTMEYYDVDINDWKVIGAMLESRAALAAVVHRGRIMMAGGMFDKERLKALNTVEVYDPRTGICSYVFPLPVAVCDSAMADVNDVVYLVGGYVIENSVPLSLDSILRYRDETDSWDLYRKLLVPRHNAVAVGLGTKLYIIGGQSSVSKNHALANVECINTLFNEMGTEIAPLLKPMFGISGCVFRRQK